MRKPTNAERDAAIREEYLDGRSVGDLADCYGLSRIRVYQICEGLRPRPVRDLEPVTSPVPGGVVLSADWVDVLRVAGKNRDDIPGAFDAWIERGQVHVHVRLPYRLDFPSDDPVVRLEGREVRDVVQSLYDPDVDPTLGELVFDIPDPRSTTSAHDLADLGRAFLLVAYRSTRLQLDQVDPAEALAFPVDRGYFALATTSANPAIVISRSAETPGAVLRALLSRLEHEEGGEQVESLTNGV